MAIFVLVPGFWLGGWAWEDVTADLRSAGHAVYPVTLTGLGDRVHLATPQVDLETHITDIVNVIEYANLRDVVLVGHSGCGMPVSVVADRIPERLAHVVYVESGPLPEGMSQFDTNPPEVKKSIEKQVAADGDGWLIPPPLSWSDPSLDPANTAGLDEAELARIRARAVPQPLAVAKGVPRRFGPARAPETLVTCTFPEEQVREMLAAGDPFFSGFTGQPRVVALRTGHWPMFSLPIETAHVLADLTR